MERTHCFFFFITDISLGWTEHWSMSAIIFLFFTWMFASRALKQFMKISTDISVATGIWIFPLWQGLVTCLTHQHWSYETCNSILWFSATMTKFPTLLGGRLEKNSCFICIVVHIHVILPTAILIFIHPLFPGLCNCCLHIPSYRDAMLSSW